ncbi:hypothetical protein N7456_012541 [Penicillium angulare]|uniref:Uncharacterized protein n=1 Tax=Penicillium angulare TaxID=116970 RepID=A0A9W9EW37_9EURO|nr:hypothetical protein N7456_012541 [Penicillium angulare]
MSNERPIPISNSQPSKYLRIATLEALITQELVSEVFLAVPSYSLWLNHIAPAPDWDTLAREQPLQEAVMRSVSSIVYSEDERDLEEAKINKISDRIASKLRPLEIDQIAFEGKCHKFLQEAFDVWRAVQRSTCRVIALTDGKASIDSPEYDIDEGVSIPHDVLRTARLEPPIVTFPTISAIADSEILHPGYALRTSNPIHISGAIEVEQQVKRARQRG